MSMGSTGTVNVTVAMLNQALNAVSDYRQTTTNLHTQLGETVSNLIPASFSGSAAEGFKTFYSSKIDPTVGESLTKLLESLDAILNGIKDAIPEAAGIDEKLSEENKK